jgi:hypothetical protein
LNEIDDNKLIEGLNGCPRLRKLSITIAKVWTLNELTNLKGMKGRGEGRESIRMRRMKGMRRMTSRIQKYGS